MVRVLLIVTGASRGLGQAIATCVAQNHDVSKLKVLLVARSSCDETEQSIKEVAAASNVQLEAVSKYAMDLSDLNSLEENIQTLLQDIQNSLDDELSSAMPYDHLLFINNAGSLGHLGPTTSMPDSLQDFRKYMDFNVTSSLWLFTRLLQAFANPTNGTGTAITMVNISSLCAVQPFTNMACYCSGKAARDMYHSVVAQELQTSNIKTLSYAPGALDTDMTAELRSAPGLEGGVAGTALIAPRDTARRLIDLVFRNEFKSGAHIDYWDLNDQGEFV